MSSTRRALAGLYGRGTSHIDGAEEAESAAWASRPDRRSYLLGIRPQNRSTFCAIISQLTEETQPLFETTIKSRAVSEDSDAKFTCIVTGYPQPEVTWYKDDEEMDRYCGLPKYEIFRHGNRHTLQLYKCREEDAGIYQASARNNKGIVSCSGVLEVGTMTEFKIHQKWFDKIKRKAEEKMQEIAKPGPSPAAFPLKLPPRPARAGGAPAGGSPLAAPRRAAPPPADRRLRGRELRVPALALRRKLSSLRSRGGRQHRRAAARAGAAAGRRDPAAPAERRKGQASAGAGRRGPGTPPAHAPPWCHPPLPALPLQQRRRALLLLPGWGAGGWKAHPRVCRRPEPHAHLILHPLTWTNKPRGSERLKAVLAPAPSLPVPLLLPAMAGGFFISKTVGIVAIVLGLGAVATIIALSVVYAQEKNKGTSDVGSNTTASPDTSTTTPAPNNPWNRWRLPTTLKPEFYEVSLQPFLKPDANNMYIFKGNSSVVFLCEEATNLILIHSKKLSYTMQGSFHATLKAEGDGSAPAISSTWLENTTQYLVVQLEAPLQQGQRYRLSSNFTGELADDLAGFYRSEYTDESGIKQVVATTQMQAADARKAFPCFDEPAMKANFSVTLIHPSGYKAISNMPAKNTSELEIDGEIWNVTEFYTTPRMSTYLLAFIVSQFTSVDNSSEGTLIRIWGRPKAIDEGQGDYALNVTGPILSFFEKHYNTAYPLPKSDQVGLPDFNAGAMENWGLVTYRENSLLFDANYSSIGNKERVVTVIAHELAHQWFGNLVTLRWWNDLWLNEGFASYVEYLGADSAEPDWNIKDLMVLNELHTVMATDALASSHPLSFREDEINTPAQISEVFDTIAYSKGASVLRMLSSFLSEDIFKEGLQSYLHNFSYSNTIYTDLWVHLQQAVDKNGVQLPDTISNIMDRWTLQMGFPLVTVDTRSGTISQAHFLLDPTSPVDRPSVFNYTWIVPITWMTGSGRGNSTYWLTQVTATDGNFSLNTPDWLLLNLNVTGYFRVNYNQENWDQLLKQLDTNHTVFPLINRAQIIDDAFNLARAKYVNVTLALDTTRFLSQETEYMPWQAALTNLKYFKQMFDRSEVFGAMSKYIKKQVTPLFEHYQKLTNNWTDIFSDYPLMVQYNEANAISTACSFGVTACQNLAIDYLRQWQNSTTNPVPANLRSAIYCSMVATGGEDAWDFLWQKFREAHVVSEADKLRTALSCSPHPWILNRYLQYTLDPTKIRKQDATSTINSIASNVVGQPLAWDFIRGNWRTLFTQYGGGSFSFSRLILSVTQRFSSEFELQQLEQFKKDNEDIGFGSGTRALEQALEQTRANIKWVEENRATVLAWFENETKSG